MSSLKQLRVVEGVDYQKLAHGLTLELLAQKYPWSYRTNIKRIFSETAITNLPLIYEKKALDLQSHSLRQAIK